MRHNLVFTSPSLSTSEMHTLGIEVLSSETSTNVSNFRFDYMIYDAPINSSISVSFTSSNVTNWIFLDDRSPYLVYTPDDGWGDVSDFPASDVNTPDDVVFNSTAMGPTTSGSVSLNFTGTSMIPEMIHPACLFNARSASSLSHVVHYVYMGLRVQEHRPSVPMACLSATPHQVSLGPTPSTHKLLALSTSLQERPPITSCFSARTSP